MSASAHALELRGLSKRYGSFTAVDPVSLWVDRGQFLTLLGPSGSGKTTILMAITGFVAPSAGAVLLDGGDITALPPERRDFGMVFQGYAINENLDPSMAAVAVLLIVLSVALLALDGALRARGQ